MGPFSIKIKKKFWARNASPENFQKIPKHGSIFWAKSLNMGTFLTSKHGLGSRGPGGTPPSKPKSSTPPGRSILEKMFVWDSLSLRFEMKIAYSILVDIFTQEIGRNGIFSRVCVWRIWFPWSETYCRKRRTVSASDLVDILFSCVGSIFVADGFAIYFLLWISSYYQSWR